MARVNIRNFKFYSITTLPEHVKEYIRDEMSYEGGGMQRIMERKRKRTRICLAYYRRKLVAWALVELDKTTAGWYEYARPSVIAWTDSRFRRNGCASATIRQLLYRHRRQLKNKHVTVYHPQIQAVVDDCGYKAHLVEWD